MKTLILLLAASIVTCADVEFKNILGSKYTLITPKNFRIGAKRNGGEMGYGISLINDKTGISIMYSIVDDKNDRDSIKNIDSIVKRFDECKAELGKQVKGDIVVSKVENGKGFGCITKVEMLKWNADPKHIGEYRYAAFAQYLRSDGFFILVDVYSTKDGQDFQAAIEYSKSQCR